MMLQKAVTPGMAQAYLDHGFDRVSGWVLSASDVSDLTSDENLRQLHQLDYPNSPFAAGEAIHILHFPSPQATPLVRANPEAMSELFPLPADGLVRVDDVATPLLWLEHTRLPAGARLWRFTPGESSPTLAGTYNGPAFGWQDEAGEFHAIPPTIIAGRVGVLDGAAYAAEPDYDEAGDVVSVTLATMNQPEDPDFAETEAGMWAKVVAFDDVDLLFESHVKATCRDLPVRVIERFSSDDGDLARISSLVLDHGANQNAKFDFIEAGVWEATLPWSELSDITPTQRVAKAWAREEDLADTTPIQAQSEAESSASAARSAWVGEGEPQVTIKASDPNDPLASDDLQEIYRDIIAEVAKAAPREADRIEMMGMCVDTNLQIASQAIFGEDVRPLPEPVEGVAPHLIKLRMATAKPDRGAWFSAFLSITPNGQFQISLDYDNEPRLTREFPAEVWAAELERFPRSEENMPSWLRAKLDSPEEE
ncbi:hypothetical protein SAMN02910418_00787 [Bowdeniella nasicola]|uniref:SseB protein N-terminal domain-containing protein n=1 Tax=Bowdeniella nasicola TaxID=208480 RepID=A0A1H3XZX5_9ACTO|nr:hypothetical protein [Bowdeniella nasicola]SEA04098.1 hypothetical protein SAMN02910418_00787 [Bowdeniella nasicola]